MQGIVTQVQSGFAVIVVIDQCDTCAGNQDEPSEGYIYRVH